MSSAKTLPAKPEIGPEVLIMWRNFDVNVDAILRRWKIEVSDQISYLNTLDTFQLAKIGQLLKEKGNSVEIKEKISSNSEHLLKLIATSYFLNLNRKVIGRALGAIFDKKGRVVESEAHIQILEHLENASLVSIYFEYLRVKLGKGDYQYKLSIKPTEENIVRFEGKSKGLANALGHSTNDERAYRFRFVRRNENGIYVLILRETDDGIFPAIPNNKRVVSAKYILSTFDFKKNCLEITTRSKREAAIIRSFAGKKLGVAIGFDLQEFEGDSKDFLSSILEIEQNKYVGIVLNGITAKESVSDLKTQLSGAQSPDQISTKLRLYRERGLILFKDISEFKSFRFQFRGIDYHVRVAGNKWGQKWLQLDSIGKPSKELKKFRDLFESHFDIKFNHALGGALVEKGIAQAILDKNKIEALLPERIEEVFLFLVKSGFIAPPKKSSKRKCLKCAKISWVSEFCPSCDGDMMILGAFLDIVHDRNKISKFFKNYLSDNFDDVLTIRSKKIEGKNHSFFVLSNGHQDDIWFHISLGEPIGHIQSSFETIGHPVVFVFSKHGKNNQSIKYSESNRVFDLLDFLYEPSTSALNNSIKDLRSHSKLRRTKAAATSYNRLQNKLPSYNDRDFEQDIYNIIYELTSQADILGGTFAGVPAPDGVGAVTNRDGKKIRKITFAWDCKFSGLKDGYKLNDKPAKHRHYLRSISRNQEIKKLGTFKTYFIISQNMNMKSYEKFYKKLFDGFNWKGHVVFVSEAAILEIFRFYLSLQDKIVVNPNLFYKEFIKLVSSGPINRGEAFPRLSDKRLNKFVEDVSKIFKKTKVKFKLKRTDFDRE